VGYFQALISFWRIRASSFGFLSAFGFYPCPSVIEHAIYLNLVGLTCRSAFFFLQVNGLKTAAFFTH
jgi:hypothetical protein